MKPGILGTWLRGLVSLAAIALVLFSMKGKLLESLAILRSEVILKWFVLGIATYVGAQFFLALRFFNILRLHEIRIGFWEVLYLVFIRLFFNLFLPSAVGGDVVKAYFVYKHCSNKMESTTSVIVDRLVGFVALMGMAGAAVLLFGRQIPDPKIRWIVYAAVGIMILALLFLGSKGFARPFKPFTLLVPSSKWREKLFALYDGLYAYRNHLQALAGGILLSLIAQAFFILVVYWMALSLGIHLDLALFFILVPVAAIASMAPSLGGLGVREAGLIYVFHWATTSERAFALSLLADCAIYGCSLLAGIIFALRGGLKPKLIHEMEALK